METQSHYATHVNRSRLPAAYAQPRTNKSTRRLKTGEGRDAKARPNSKLPRDGRTGNLSVQFSVSVPRNVRPRTRLGLDWFYTFHFLFRCEFRLRNFIVNFLPIARTSMLRFTWRKTVQRNRHLAVSIDRQRRQMRPVNLAFMNIYQVSERNSRCEGLADQFAMNETYCPNIPHNISEMRADGESMRRF